MQKLERRSGILVNAYEKFPWTLMWHRVLQETRDILATSFWDTPLTKVHFRVEYSAITSVAMPCDSENMRQ